MILAGEEIIKQVRLRLDEIRDNDSDLDGLTDETDLDTLIESLSLEALRFVNRNASVSLLEADRILSVDGSNSVSVGGIDLPSESAEARIQNRPPGSDTGEYSAFSELAFEINSSLINGRKIGVFSGIPSNFLRLCKVTCASWRRAVDSVILDSSIEWGMLMDYYLTGSIDNPMVGLVQEPDGTKGIYLFCLKDNDASVPKISVSYMEDPEWKTEGLNVSRYLTEPFYYYLASLVLLTMGDNRSQNAQAMAFPLMGIEAVQQQQ